MRLIRLSEAAEQQERDWTEINLWDAEFYLSANASDRGEKF